MDNVNRSNVKRASTSVVMNVNVALTIVNDALMVINVSSAGLIFNLMAADSVKRASLTNTTLVASA
jgi:hypothetical protein